MKERERGRERVKERERGRKERKGELERMKGKYRMTINM